MRKITPYNILKGIRYLKHFGPREFLVRLRERMEPEEVPYGPWYAAYVPTEQELEEQRKKKFRDGPVFSVVVPCFRTPERYLREMIGSVLGQTYASLELCLVNASPEDNALSAVLKEYEKKDPRVKVLTLEKNLGIAGNTQKGIAAATGNFIALLDHDDMISPSALYQMASYIGQHPETGLLYTDEDKISENSEEHFQPHLKPDYSPDLLRSNNYICHFLAVRADVAAKAGPVSTEYDGAQDHEWIFRCIYTAHGMGLEVGHVPEILYHWRTHAASTADNPMSKQYACDAGRRAIESDLKRSGTPGRVEAKKDLGFYRVIYPVREEALISVIIPNKDEKDTLEKCLRSIREKSTYTNYEILVVENNSVTEEIFDYYKEIDGKDRIRVLYWDGPFNYSAINNFGFAHAKGDYILCLNNDMEVITPGWMEEMLGVCQRPEVGITGAKLIYPDNTIQHAGIVIGIGGIAGSMFVGMNRSFSGYLHKADLMQDLSAVTAACMMVRASLWRELGGFEERLTVAFNDVDFCLRVREAGYLVVYDPYVQLYHYESKSRGKEDTKDKVRRFQTEIEYIRSRWTGLLRGGDPYYNKNLSLSKWNYSLKPGERMR